MPFDQPVPRPFAQTDVQSFAPSAPGVYGISNAREWIYIGETDNIRFALLAHMREWHASVMERHPTGFVWELCDGPQRTTRQNRLVLEYEPVFNRRMRR